ncbi:isoamyl alcohol [Colletotrichum truncatum]|uniref:Isoamyl alcohol n=1 Tax=Colletotrichum truncatum TaxID=5467 RepID=A0ACC3Z8G7_COLTU|nr:isoamyl alcohol [Colletotrichum truncatum]KAF6789134.1 isoamyl alcohol [Colletotrichum truncatum]
MARTTALSLFALLSAVGGVSAQQSCKLTPFDAAWPSDADWSALNTTIGGTLIGTKPIASSCYPGNSFHSPQSCDEVKKGWGYSDYHASLPESIDYPLYANNSCLPPGATGYSASKGCEIGGLPQYVVNATTEEQVATAMSWASKRNIRIVVKGTGHDLNGRSSGAYALSIWTPNFNKLEFAPEWRSPGDNSTEVAMIVGSGNNWGAATRGAAKFGKVLVGGTVESVGTGGQIQGGGHGPLSSTFGLAADQILQARVITTEGQILVANDAQNQDLLWAIRGGGGGQYGVVTEYVLKAHDNPGNVVSLGIELSTERNDTEAKEATWRSLATLLASVPDLMDAGLTGTAMFNREASATSANATRKVSGSLGFFAYNTTTEKMVSLLEPVRARMLAAGGGNGTVSVQLGKPSTQPDFMSLFEGVNASPSAAGQYSLMTSRLLGRKQLCDIPVSTLASYLKKILASQDPAGGGFAVIGLQGGIGPRSVPEKMRGAVNPVWRSTYIHMMSYVATLDTTIAPKEALASAAEWLEETKESVWREWAPGSGSYMNEANAFNSNFKEDFYGENYARLLEIKRKYDPTESLFVLSGVGSDAWEYDLNSGKLCKTA